LPDAATAAEAMPDAAAGKEASGKEASGKEVDE
jgi:hypothetical protein